jgi:hypothetical protein
MAKVLRYLSGVDEAIICIFIETQIGTTWTGNRTRLGSKTKLNLLQPLKITRETFCLPLYTKGVAKIIVRKIIFGFMMQKVKVSKLSPQRYCENQFLS